MGLPSGSIRSRSGGRMAVDAERNRIHVVAMRMVVEIGAIAIIMTA